MFQIGEVIRRVTLRRAWRRDMLGRFASPPRCAGQEHPQGDKIFNGRTHQVFGHQSISKVESGRLAVVHTTSIEDGLYEDEVDYTKMAF